MKCLKSIVFLFLIPLIPYHREEYELLDAVQSRLALYPLTAPVLGNNHSLYRGRGCPVSLSHFYKYLKEETQFQYFSVFILLNFRILL